MLLEFPVGGNAVSVRGGVREEVCYWGWTLRVYSLVALPVPFLCFLCVDDNVICQLSAPTSVLSLTVALPSPHGF